MVPHSLPQSLDESHTPTRYIARRSDTPATHTVRALQAAAYCPPLFFWPKAVRPTVPEAARASTLDCRGFPPSSLLWALLLAPIGRTLQLSFQAAYQGHTLGLCHMERQKVYPWIHKSAHSPSRLVTLAVAAPGLSALLPNPA